MNDYFLRYFFVFTTDIVTMADLKNEDEDEQRKENVAAEQNVNYATVHRKLRNTSRTAPSSSVEKRKKNSQTTTSSRQLQPELQKLEKLNLDKVYRDGHYTQESFRSVWG